MRPASLLSLLGPLMLVQAVYIAPVVREAAVIADDVVEGSDAVITDSIEGRSDPFLQWMKDAHLDDCKVVLCSIAMGLPNCGLGILVGGAWGVLNCIVSLVSTTAMQPSQCDHCKDAAEKWLKNKTHIDPREFQLNDRVFLL